MCGYRAAEKGNSLCCVHWGHTRIRENRDWELGNEGFAHSSLSGHGSMFTNTSSGSHGSTDLNRIRHQDMTAVSFQSARPYMQRTSQSMTAAPESPSSCLDKATPSNLWVFCVLLWFFFNQMITFSTHPSVGIHTVVL